MVTTTPPIVRTIAQLRKQVAAARQAGHRVGLVPTMGALHAGHLSLVDAAAAECDFIIATIFVNPTQFGPNEDFTKYPRTLEADLAKLSQHRVDIVFVPETAEMYPTGSATRVEVKGAAREWEGACLPGHFGGVATIVLKLFQIAQADVAYFGRKDLQQTRVIMQMVRDLNVPIEIRVCPTLREPDGLAMSSRNVYLSPEERRAALVLSRSLNLAQDLVGKGERSAARVLAAMQKLLATEPSVRVEYVAVVDPVTLATVEQIKGGAYAIIAARVGATRLIDNEPLGDIS